MGHFFLTTFSINLTNFNPLIKNSTTKPMWLYSFLTEHITHVKLMFDEWNQSLFCQLLLCKLEAYYSLCFRNWDKDIPWGFGHFLEVCTSYAPKSWQKSANLCFHFYKFKGYFESNSFFASKKNSNFPLFHSDLLFNHLLVIVSDSRSELEGVKDDFSLVNNL